MPILVKPELLAVLREKLQTMDTSVGKDALVSSLNEPQEVGVQVGTVTAEGAIALLSKETIAALEDLATTEMPTAAAARTTWAAAVAWWDYLNITGTISLAEGTQGRDAVDALVAGGLMTEAERTSRGRR